MLSGYGMMSKKRDIKDIFAHIWRLLVVYVSWMIVFGIIDGIILLAGGESFGKSINALVKSVIFGQFHVWYIFALIGLYLLTPLFSKITEDRKLAIYILVLTTIATFVLPLLGNIPDWERFKYTLGSFNLSYLCGYLFYYVFGGCLHVLKPQENKGKISLYLGATLVLAAASVVTIFESSKQNAASQEWFDDMLPFGGILYVTMFVALMCFFETIKLSIPKRLVAIGLPIYLMHITVLDMLGNVVANGYIKALLTYAICVTVCLTVSMVPGLRYFMIYGKRINKQ